MGDRKDYHENKAAEQGQEGARDPKQASASSQKGPQSNAEGQHGNKTHARLIEQLHEGESRESRADRIQHDREQTAQTGGRRLVEDREQHDEAEKNSEHTQLFAEHKLHRDDGPSDNIGNLHGALEHRESRADNRPRDSRGPRSKD